MHGVDPFELSDVIRLIYDAASDASAWPQLLERLGLFMLRAAESQGDEGGRERVMRDIEAFLDKSQEQVTGKVFVQLMPYRYQVTGIESPFDLMSSKFGKYGEMNTGFTGNRLGNQSFTGSRRAVKQYTARDLGAKGLELLRLL